jgi:nucleoside-diphosphate-sugar epimerase
MRILITGGTGFIGTRLALACRDAGDIVRVLGQTNTPAESSNAEELREAGIELLLGSVLDGDLLDQAAANCDCVYHLAAAQHEAGKPDEHFRKINVEGTRAVLQACAKCGVGRLVHGSTIGVYSANGSTTVRDNTETIPDNIYGITKLEAEKLVQDAAPDLPVVIVRISETYGPGDRRLLKLFKGIQTRKYFHIGACHNLHHPIYISDLIDGLRMASVSDAAVGKTMVLPGYEALTTRGMVEAIAAALEVPAPKVTVPLWPLWSAAVVMETTLRPLGIHPPLHRRRMHFFTKSFEFDGRASRELLGFEPGVPFAEGARRTAHWYRQAGIL